MYKKITKMKRLLFIFLTVFLIHPVFANQKADLIPLNQGILPNEEMIFAIKLPLQKGEHVYWKNPGDAGEALEYHFELPENFKITDTIWPIPEKFKTGPFTEYGYQNVAYIFVKIKAPQNLEQGKLLKISADLSWLACQGECIPQHENVSAFITTGIKSKNNPEIEQFLNKLPSIQQIDFYETDSQFIFVFDNLKNIKNAYYFTEQTNVLNYSDLQVFKQIKETGYLFINKLNSTEQLSGIVSFYDEKGIVLNSIQINAQKNNSPLQIPTDFCIQDVLLTLLFALLGGFLLNLMPCVFPVLFLKAYKLMNHQSPSFKKETLLYFAGILTSFIILGIILNSFKQIGWGFQLQNPYIVYGLSLFMFVLGLLFLDVFTIGTKLQSWGANYHVGDFGTGVLAVIVASPCAAPFMGIAIGYGLSHGSVMTIAVMLMMGVGLSLPFLVFAYFPKTTKILPKPGKWMIHFKHFLSLPMFATTGWLAFVLENQVPNSLIKVFVSLGIIALLAIIYGTFQTGISLKQQKTKIIFITFCLVCLTYFQGTKVEKIEWMPFDEQKIMALHNQKIPVFVKFTAKWCLTCLTNEKIVLNTDKVKALFTENGVAAFSADWTKKNPEITKKLNSFGRNGVPLYVYFPVDGKPVILGQILSFNTLKEVIE